MRLLRHRLLLSLLALVACMGSQAQEAGYVMCVTLNDGTIDRFVVADLPTAYFHMDKVEVSTLNVRVEYAIADVKDYTFVEADATSVEEAMGTRPEEGIAFRYADGKTVSIRGINADTPIGVYALSGMKQAVPIVRTADGAEVSLSPLPAGTYIIHIKNSKSIKIQKR